MRLPLDCVAEYHPDYIDRATADSLYTDLTGMPVVTDRAVFDAAGQSFRADFGKVNFVDPDRNASGLYQKDFGDRVAPWPDGIRAVRDRLAKDLGRDFGVCVSIFYPDGTSGVDYHSDPPAFGDTSLIASISLGAGRVFSFRHKQTGKVFNQILGHGSLVVMGAGCQDLYEHALPVAPSCHEARINLTFRMVGPS